MYFRGRGKLYLALRDAVGNPGAFWQVGNVPDLKFSFETDKLEHQEKQSGKDLTDLTIFTKISGSLSATLEEILQDNLSLLLQGEVVTSAGGAVTGEVLPTVKVGQLAILKGQDVSTVTIKDSTTGTAKTFPPAGYTVNAKTGSIIFNDLTTGGPYVQPFKVDYTAGTTANVTKMMTATAQEYWVRFEGINTADSDKAVAVDLYRFRPAPAKDFALISDDLAQFATEGDLLADLTRAASDPTGQFGRIISA
jgi:hypothetical protein